MQSITTVTYKIRYRYRSSDGLDNEDYHFKETATMILFGGMHTT